MRITTKNYFKAISEVGFENLPEVLKKSHLLIEDRTDKGNDWSIYENDTEVKRVFDLSFEKLDEFIDRKDLNGITNEELNGNFLTPKDVAINLIKPSVLKGDTIDLHPTNKLSVKDPDFAAHIEGERVVVTMLYGTKISESFLVNDLMEEIVRVDFKTKYHSENAASENTTRKKRTTFNHKQPEFKVLKAILNWHNANVSKRQVEFFINELQGYIKSKKINKESIVADEIKLVQEKLICVFNSMGERIKVELSPETKKIFQNALKKVTDVTKYDLPKKKKGLNGVEEVQEVKPKQNLMNSIDFANLHFNTIGFSGKWLNLIGDPSPGFTAMVFGRPKMGKSYLCVDFAGYLARNHGTVLYVANEEKLDATLQMKLNDKDVKHKNLFVSDYLPEDLSKYQFIILDSVNKLGLSPQDLEKLKRSNPGKSFIFIFQTTKDGKFKGANSYQHDVDFVIEVPERGKATQFGRFNQGGEMNVFEDESQELSGIKKSIKPIKKMEIETELGMPLEELAMEFVNKKEPQEKIIEILDHEPESIYPKLKKMFVTQIKEEKLKIEVGEIEFTQMDSDNLNHGAAYFMVKLSGTKPDLEKIAGDGLLFNYDWEDGVAGVRKSRKNLEVPKKVSNVDTMKKKAKIIKDWTEPEFLNRSDWRDLKLVKKYYDEGDLKQAMNYASRLETIVREEIPSKIWMEIGGELTKTGKDRLMSKDYDNRDDDINPRFIFSTTSTALLAEALRGDFDLKQLVRQELANRGLNSEGNWVGFDQAAKIHKMIK
ncbi:MAG: hypothetical protein H0W75_00015 [Chitinophagaceae bacterium]|nr:hypothetical protein [Chitinophagaceae bacterium]